MNRQNREYLDRAAAQVRATQPDPEEVRRAAERVWARLSAETGTAPAAATAAPAAAIAGCADVQASIPALLSGELPASRRLLIEDHTRECVPCRRALIAARTGRPAHAPAPRTAARTAAASPRFRMALAASLVALVGIAGWFATDGLFAGEVATLAAADGLVFGLDGSTEGGMAPLAIGTMIDSGRSFRTGKGSTAVVRLEDGSEVEVAPRTQLSIRERRRGTIIRVDRGAVIVEAADQRPKQLFVETADARVAVTGTIFSVEHGVRGSRVGVVEGEVRVDAGGRKVVLHPGDQTTSRASLTPLPVARQVAWSRNVDHYVALLEELAGLRRELTDRLPPAESRYDSALAPLVPADTFAYVAIPNLTTTIAESWSVFRERLAVSPTLAEWWGERVEAGDAAEIDDTIGRLTALGSHLGDEVVVALLNDEGDGDPEGVLFLAEVARPDAFAAAVEAEIARLAAEHEGGDGQIVVVRDLAELTGAEDGLIVWVSAGGVMAASDSAERLAAFAAALAAGGSGFTATELGQAVERAYSDGTQWLLAVDLGAAVAADAAADPELAATGFSDVDRLVVEYWDEGTRSVMSAELGFTGERRGIASWLAAPAPMGTLDFISAEAHAAAAFVVKEPSAMLEDLFAIAGSDDPELARLEEEIGLSLADDVAAPLGGEVAFALDGPFLPKPAWKVVLEVYDPARLQHTIGIAVARLNDKLRAEGEQEVTLSSQQDGGRTWHRLDSRHAGFSWVYVDGYLVAAPSKALLERTLDQRAAGATLPASGRFRELLPADVRADFSALLYQNVGPLLAPVAGGLSSLGEGAMSESQRETLQALIREARPTVAYAYGEPDRVIFAGTGPGGPFGMGFQALSGFGGLAMMGDVLDEAADQQAVEVR